MEPDYLICDACGAKTTWDMRFHIDTDTCIDAAGARGSVGYEVDLCPKCLAKLFKHYYDKDFRAANVIVDILKKWKVPIRRYDG